MVQRKREEERNRGIMHLLVTITVITCCKVLKTSISPKEGLFVRISSLALGSPILG